jgi:chloramphenicol-sensitive protein RarD
VSASLKAGYLYGLIAYIWWGLVPIYFRALGDVPAGEILAHRIAWSILLMIALTAFIGGWKPLTQALRSRRVVLTMLLSGTLLAGNWFLYIYATVTKRVTEASLGYYMMPLVNAFFATLFLGEKLRKAQIPALALIAVGVSIPFLAKGEFTWLAVALPITFGLYGLVRKVAHVDSLTGITVETFLLGIPSAAFLIWQSRKGIGSFGMNWQTSTLLMLGGVITVVPLLTYIASLRRLPLIAASFIQFLSPSMQMLLAVLVFQEEVTWDRWAAIGCVWFAVAIFITDAALANRRKPAKDDTDEMLLEEPTELAIRS